MVTCAAPSDHMCLLPTKARSQQPRGATTRRIEKESLCTRRRARGVVRLRARHYWGKCFSPLPPRSSTPGSQLVRAHSLDESQTLQQWKPPRRGLIHGAWCFSIPHTYGMLIRANNITVTLHDTLLKLNNHSIHHKSSARPSTHYAAAAHR